MKIVALKWLPLLLSSLGSYSFHLITDILPGLLSCGEAVQEEIGKVIGSLACVLTENTMIKKLKNELPFDHPVCSSITFLCPDCDSVVLNKTGNTSVYICSISSGLWVVECRITYWIRSCCIAFYLRLEPLSTAVRVQGYR